MSGDYEPVRDVDLQLNDWAAGANTTIHNDSQGLLSARMMNLEDQDRPHSSASQHTSGSDVTIGNQTSNDIPRSQDFGTVNAKVTALAQTRRQSYEQDDDSQHGHPTMADPTDSPAVLAPRSARSFMYRLWLWEVTASVFSLVCMAAIVGVLLYEDGRRLDEWGLGYAFSSPTVVISLLGTLAKSASVLVITEVISQLKWLHFNIQPQTLSDLQLFDRASRGPWGALNLAFFKNRKAVTASCASLLMLCFLLFDPFTQSVFQFPVVLSPVKDAKTSILASLEYDPSSLSVSAASTCPGPRSIYSRMQAGILSPILNNTQPPSLPCAFEQCEWPTITTLGACSSCLDVTETVIPTCVGDDSRWTLPIRCNYTVPLTNTTIEAVFGRYGGASSTSLLATVWGSKANQSESLGWASSGGLESGATDLASLTFVQLFPDTFHGDHLINGSLESFPPIRRAMHCKFELCARTFTRPYYANFRSSPLTGPQTRLVQSTKDAMFITMTGKGGRSSTSSLIGLRPSNPSDLPADTVFRINYCDWEHISAYLADLFTATMTSAGPSFVDEDRWTPNLGIPLSQADDVEALMHDIADSMTEVMRTSPNSTQFDGRALNSVTYIRIKWERLVLPLCAIVLSSLMLIVIIIRSRAGETPAWKSSSLALLFHGLEGWSDDELKAEDPEHLDEKSAKMKAQVLCGDDGKPAFFNKAS